MLSYFFAGFTKNMSVYGTKNVLARANMFELGVGL